MGGSNLWFEIWVDELMDLQDDLAGQPRRTEMGGGTNQEEIRGEILSYVVFDEKSKNVVELMPQDYHARINLRGAGLFPHYDSELTQ